MGPIAGLAAGLGLAALASHLGFGEEMANFLMMALLAMAAFMLIRWFMRRNQPAAAPAHAIRRRRQRGQLNPNSDFQAPRGHAGLRVGLLRPGAPAARRTFAIISHPDAGKTTLTEKLLLYGGAIHLAGSVRARKATRHATSDWMKIEQERGISVTTVLGDAVRVPTGTR
jgi:hypothetical protein